MRATKETAVRFHAVAYDLAPAVVAHGRERVNGALETVKHVRAAGLNQLKSFIVIVTTYFTLGHNPLAFPS
jgi:hypothetical protein